MSCLQQQVIVQQPGRLTNCLSGRGPVVSPRVLTKFVPTRLMKVRALFCSCRRNWLIGGAQPSLLVAGVSFGFYTTEFSGEVGRAGAFPAMGGSPKNFERCTCQRSASPAPPAEARRKRILLHVSGLPENRRKCYLSRRFAYCRVGARVEKQLARIYIACLCCASKLVLRAGSGVRVRLRWQWLKRSHGARKSPDSRRRRKRTLGAG
jgi:hypothetical protein